MGENGLSVADALALQNKNGTTAGDGFLGGGQGAFIRYKKKGEQILTTLLFQNLIILFLS